MTGTDGPDESLLMLINDRHLDLTAKLVQFGFSILGWFRPDNDDAQEYFKGSTNRIGFVIINSGRKMWNRFCLSQEFQDGLPDPLNRWSRDVLDAIASDLDAELVLPFDQPYPPVQQWAMKAGGLARSPLGILIHPEYGLWFGIRGVLFFEVNAEIQLPDKLIQVAAKQESICELCVEKPCLSSCPVTAFSESGLDVTKCFEHIDLYKNSQNSLDCFHHGCIARASCPVGSGHQHSIEQLQFHMRSYRG